MHAAFYRPNDIDWTGLNHQFFLDVALFSWDCFKSLTEIFVVLTNNNIWKSRLVGVGSVNFNDVVSYGISGPVVRSVGVKKDIRFYRSETYASYWFLSLHSYLGRNGDSYDRFLIRLREMYESINIVFQILTNLTNLALSSNITSNNINQFNDYISFFISFFSVGKFIV
jgi:NADH dehydrogenase (ubiquinone) Fe-S protein 2